MILEKLIVPLLADISQFKTELANAQGVATTTSTNIGKSLSGIGGNLTKIGAIGTATVTAPILAMGTAAVASASDLEESMNKVSVVFGETGDEITTWSENTATSMGISQQNALEAAGTFGNLFSAMEVGQQDTADMSTGLVQLASDLASFNNLDPTEVLEKLRSGMVGQSEPLRALGVNLTAAAVETKAFELGLADANGVLTEADLVTARYALIMEQTTLAQGDFARTSDGLANSTRINKAEFANLSAQLGTILIPLVNKLMTAVTPVLDWFLNMTPAGQQAMLTFAGIAAVIPPVITVAGGLAKGVGSLITLFGTGGGLAGVGTFISGTVLPGIGSAITFLATNPVGWLILAIGALIFVIVKFGDDALNTVKMVWTIVKYYFGLVADFLSNTFTKAWDGITNAIKTVISWVQNLIDKFKNIKIPAWLTPGSPTPFEMGIRGISDAMRTASMQVLPRFSTQLTLAGASNPVNTNYSSGNGEVVRLLGDISNRKELDANELALKIRDALVMAMG